MKRICLCVAYDGTDYSGWQLQKNAVTVEGVLTRALRDLLGEDVELIGASRTDSGVHALGNVAVFDTETRIPADKIAVAVNQRLPETIRVQRSEEVAGNFHPRYCESIKTYEYTILNTAMPIPTESRYSYHVYRKLDVRAMREAAKELVGTHDFSAYCSAGSQVKSKVRTIFKIEIDELPVSRYCILKENSENSGFVKNNMESIDYKSSELKSIESKNGETYHSASLEEKKIILRVNGNGFLYNMVRIIAGTLIEVGEGRRGVETVREALEKGQRNLAGPTAPPQGLMLMGIEY